MIIEYHRPDNLNDVLALLARKDLATVPMGGGTKLNQPSPKKIAVVDLQTLVSSQETILGKILPQSSGLVIGAGVTLQTLSEYPNLPEALSLAIRAETNFNLRHVSTVAGSLVSAKGRSTFAAALLAMAADLNWISLGKEAVTIPLSEFLLFREEQLPGKLILSVRIPLNIRLAYQAVSRTPSDFPIVAAFVCRWASGRTRVSLAGFGAAPIVAFDGPDSKGAAIAARQAYQEAEDQWASAGYRSAMAEVLVERILILLESEG